MAKLSLGIQLYTVRAELQDDFKGTLAALAEMGYQGVEFARKYGGMSPDELADFLKSVGLTTAGLHTSLAEVLNPESETHAYARGLGSPYISCASLNGEDTTDWDAVIARVQQAGVVARGQGLIFTYHNHATEFAMIDGEHALDLLYAKTDPAYVQAELDTYWVAKGGEDPVPYLRKYAGRVPQVHIKDMDPTDGSFAEVGAGCLDTPGILAVAREIGSEWVIVEQDVCKGPALESARISIENIKKMGLG